MSFEQGSILSVQMKQLLLGKQVMNKLFYRVVSRDVDVDLFNVFTQLSQEIANAMVTVQSENLTHTSQVYLDETDGIGIQNTGAVAQGDVVTFDDLPTSNAFGATKTVASRLTRPGGIRIAGVTEVSASGNTIDSGTLALLVPVGTALAAQQQYFDGSGDEITLNPVVVGRLVDGSLDLTKVQNIESVGLWRLTTQVSRR